MSALNGRRLRPVRSGSSSTPAEKTAERIGGAARGAMARLSVGAAIFIILLIIALGAFFWFEKVYANPEHVFWGTMANNLSTSGITKEITQSGGSGSNEEIAQLSFVPEPRMRLVRKQALTGTSGTTSLTLESIITPTDSYQHYLSIDRPTRGAKKLDYSSVYSLWVKNQGVSSTYNSALFSTAVLCGNLTLQQRKEVLEKLRPAYAVDLAKVERKTENGRRIYTYKVAINLQKYAAADSLYARYIGLPNAAHLSPKGFHATDKVSATFKVDVLAHELKQITYKSTNVAEKYSSYGVTAEMKPPNHTVSYQRLQQALSQIR